MMERSSFDKSKDPNKGSNSDQGKSSQSQDKSKDTGGSRKISKEKPHSFDLFRHLVTTHSSKWLPMSRCASMDDIALEPSRHTEAEGSRKISKERSSSARWSSTSICSPTDNTALEPSRHTEAEGSRKISKERSSSLSRSSSFSRIISMPRNKNQQRLEEQLSQSHQDHQQLQDQHQRLQNQRKELEDQLRKSKQDLQNQQKLSDEQLKQIKQEYQMLLQDHQESQNQLEQINQKYQKLLQDHQESQNQLEQIRQNRQKLLQNHQESQDQLEQINRKRQRLLQDHQNSQNQLDQVNQEYQQLSQDHRKSQNQLDQVNQEYQQLSQDHQESQNQLEQIKQECQQLQKKKQDLQEQLSTTRRDYQQSQDQFKKEKKDLLESRQLLESSLKDQLNKAKHLEAEVKQLEVKCQKNDEELKELKQYESKLYSLLNEQCQERERQFKENDEQTLNVVKREFDEIYQNLKIDYIKNKKPDKLDQLVDKYFKESDYIDKLIVLQESHKENIKTLNQIFDKQHQEMMSKLKQDYEKELEQFRTSEEQPQQYHMREDRTVLTQHYISKNDLIKKYEQEAKKENKRLALEYQASRIELEQNHLNKFKEQEELFENSSKTAWRLYTKTQEKYEQALEKKYLMFQSLQTMTEKLSKAKEDNKKVADIYADIDIHIQSVNLTVDARGRGEKKKRVVSLLDQRNSRSEDNIASSSTHHGQKILTRGERSILNGNNKNKQIAICDVKRSQDNLEREGELRNPQIILDLIENNSGWHTPSDVDHSALIPSSDNEIDKKADMSIKHELKPIESEGALNRLLKEISALFSHEAHAEKIIQSIQKEMHLQGKITDVWHERGKQSVYDAYVETEKVFEDRKKDFGNKLSICEKGTKEYEKALIDYNNLEVEKTQFRNHLVQMAWSTIAKPMIFAAEYNRQSQSYAHDNKLTEIFNKFANNMTMAVYGLRIGS
jgi:hypothetical protein